MSEGSDAAFNSLVQVVIPPNICTIAGSDASGGAGIQADLKTIAAHQCYGSSVITALTAQNTLGVQGVHLVPADFVLQQLRSVFDDVAPAFIKMGMLPTAEIIKVVGSLLKSLGKDKPGVVLDPVMISTSGHQLIGSEAVEALKELFPLVDWLTPNIPEAQRLTGTEKALGGLKGMLELAEKMSRCGARRVLIKGGHMPFSREEVRQAAADGLKVVWAEGDDEKETIEVLSQYRKLVGSGDSDKLVVDVLMEQGGKPVLFVGQEIRSESTHGTGCTLSSAIACEAGLALQREKGGPNWVHNVTRKAIAYTQGAIAAAYPIGKGHGPLHHAYMTVSRGVSPPTHADPHPFTTYLINSCLDMWKSYVRHPWVVQLGKGTLPRKSFEHYIIQDWHYLRHYARAHAMGAYKATTFADIKAFTDIAAHITRESEMHVQYCEQFGVSRAQLEAATESSACAAYARYILDIGVQGDILELYVAVASCLIGYGEVGLWLGKQVEKGQAKIEGNVYGSWMQAYASEDFMRAVNVGIDNLERRIRDDPPTPQRLERLTEIWRNVVRLERDFWDMGMAALA